MTRSLTARELEMLEGIVQRKGESFTPLYIEFIDGNTDYDVIDVLCKLINEEYLQNGIKPDFEPNPYGKELATLLNIVNRRRL